MDFSRSERKKGCWVVIMGAMGGKSIEMWFLSLCSSLKAFVRGQGGDLFCVVLSFLYIGIQGRFFMRDKRREALAGM